MKSKICRKRDEKNRAYDKRRYYESKAKGMCTYCHSRSVQDGMTKCSECKAKSLLKLTTWRAKKGKDYVNAYATKLRVSYVERGMCQICGAKLNEMQVRVCERCHLLVDKRRDLRRFHARMHISA